MASPATVETASGIGTKVPVVPTSFVDRLQYFRRIFHSYLLPGPSQLTFWHETPQVNLNARTDELDEYYMPFAQSLIIPVHSTPPACPCLSTTGRSAGNTTRSRSRNGGSETTTHFAAGKIKTRMTTARINFSWPASGSVPISNRIPGVSGCGTTISIGNIALASGHPGIPVWPRDRVFLSWCAPGRPRATRPAWMALTRRFKVSAGRFLKAAFHSPMKLAISGLRSTS